MHIDPRIRARRIEVQRDAGRRRLQRLVDLGVVVAVVVGFAVALRTPLLNVDAVTVVGNHHTSTSLLLERAGIHRGDQLIDIDLHAAGTRLANLPWIGQVHLHRGLDGQVQVRVVERTPVAVVTVGAAAVLVDAEGRALAAPSDDPGVASTLAQIRGGAALPAPGEYLAGDAQGLLDLAGRLAEGVPGIVLEQATDGSVTGTLPSGASVRFGLPLALAAKVRALRTVLDQVDLTCAAMIDVRAPGSPVLTREDRCS